MFLHIFVYIYIYICILWLYNIFLVPIFSSKIVSFPCHQVVDISSCVLHQLAGRIFFSLFWNVLFGLYNLILSRYVFNLPSFASILLLIFSSGIVCFTCVAFFFFSSQHMPAFFLYLIILACWRRFLICVSSQISQPGSEFLFVFLKRTPILSQTNFASAEISCLILWLQFVASFSRLRKLMVFHLSLSDSKSLQVSRTLLSILADLKNAVFWMVSCCSFISKISSPFVLLFPSLQVPLTSLSESKSP